MLNVIDKIVYLSLWFLLFSLKSLSGELSENADVKIFVTGVRLSAI